MEVLTHRLRWLREENRLGQKEVAAEIGISTSGYQKMEYGDSKPKIEVLIKIAKFYNVSTDFLLGLSDVTKQLNALNKKFLILKHSIKTNKESIEHYSKHGNTEQASLLVMEQAHIYQEINKVAGQYLITLIEIPHYDLSRNEIVKDFENLILVLDNTSLTGKWQVIISDPDKGFQYTLPKTYKSNEEAENKARYYNEKCGFKIINFHKNN